MFEAVDASRSALLPWMPWAEKEHRSPDASLETIRLFERQYEDRTGFTVGIFDRGDGRLLGGTGLHRLESEGRSAEVGYWVRADARRQGICTEAMRAWVTHAVQAWAFRRVFLYCAAVNVPSVAVARSLGFRQEAILKAYRWEPGYGWCDQFLFAVLANEWDAVAGKGPGGTSWG